MKAIPKKFPGLGFIIVIVIVLLVGYVSGSFIVSKLVELFDKILEKTPGIKIIYSTVKDFFEAFAGNKRKFDKAVLVSIESIRMYGELDLLQRKNCSNSACRNMFRYIFRSHMHFPAIFIL